MTLRSASRWWGASVLPAVMLLAVMFGRWNAIPTSATPELLANSQVKDPIALPTTNQGEVVEFTNVGFVQPKPIELEHSFGLDQIQITGNDQSLEVPIRSAISEGVLQKENKQEGPTFIPIDRIVVEYFKVVFKERINFDELTDIQRKLLIAEKLRSFNSHMRSFVVTRPQPVLWIQIKDVVENDGKISLRLGELRGTLGAAAISQLVPNHRRDDPDKIPTGWAVSKSRYQLISTVDSVSCENLGLLANEIVVINKGDWLRVFPAVQWGGRDYKFQSIFSSKRSLLFQDSLTGFSVRWAFPLLGAKHISKQAFNKDVEKHFGKDSIVTRRLMKRKEAKEDAEKTKRSP